MYTLYYSPGTASMCVHQALIEANAHYRLVLVDLQAGQQRDPTYLRLNPGGVVRTRTNRSELRRRGVVTR
jgi:glutathione S-transferase